MAAAGLYTIGGSFWEFGEPDWDLTRYFVMFGVAEDHDSNPIKTGLGHLKGREDAKFVSVNPVRTGYSAISTFRSSDPSVGLACCSSSWIAEFGLPNGLSTRRRFGMRRFSCRPMAT